MIIHNNPQQTDEWKQDRLGHFTASSAVKLFMSEGTKGYKEYILSVAYEKVFGESPEGGYKNYWMDRGNQFEDIARKEYQRKMMTYVKQVGFIELDEWVGASVDGIVGDNGLVEIKCRKWSVQYEYLLKNEIPNDAYYQMQMQMMVTEREWCDYYSFHPKLKAEPKRVEKDSYTQNEINKKLNIAIEKAKEQMIILSDISKIRENNME